MSLSPTRTAKASADALHPLIVFNETTRPIAEKIAIELSLETALVDDLAEGALDKIDAVVLGDLHDLALVRTVRRIFGAKPPAGLIRGFVVAASGAARHADEVQANALGATHFLKRGNCLPQVQQMLSIARREPLDPARVKDLLKAPGGESIVVTGKLLAATFRNLTAGEAIDLKSVDTVGQQIMSNIGAAGAEDWLTSVRDYHEGTFQHCLLVTGTAASFARLHIAKPELAKKLTSAALLHDIGKAVVPLHILDKPGRLTDEEFEAIKRHPAAGYDYLLLQKNIDPQVLDAVRHHHEALDGSGYPDGLRGDQIAPMTRILTVCDIFAALVEARSYKPAKPPEEAITILVGMALNGKVDYQVVRGLAEVFAIRTPKTLAEVQTNLVELRR